MSITAALALTAANERQIIRAFRAQHALDVPTARSLRELGLNDSRSLRTMVVSAVIRRVGPERYFLDERIWADRRQLRGATIARLLVALAIGVAGVALYFYGR